MGERENESAVTFLDLKWDTEFFGITCAKAILHKSLTQQEWAKTKERFQPYRFVSIENRNSEPVNAQLIGSETNAFLADVNIQFSKKPEAVCINQESIRIYHSMEYDSRILEMADFAFSKFIEDPQLAQRGGADVYRQWLINSFGKTDKFFAIDESTDINGFLLYTFSGRTCIIELISVSSNLSKKGIGTNLFRAVESIAYQQGCDEMKVGTQVRNIRAINFYHKVGCKMVECHQIYHLWKQ